MNPLEYRPERPLDGRPGIDRQPSTVALPDRIAQIEAGRCLIHRRSLSYHEAKVGACSWCTPVSGEGAAEQGRLF